MDIRELSVNLRNKTGKGPARTLRSADMVPAVLYGPNTDPINLTVKVKDFETAVKKGKVSQMLFNLTVVDGGQDKYPAMIKELQKDTVSQRLVHIDFYKVNMKRKISVMVSVKPVGKAAGVEAGGILQTVRREIEVFCLPTNIPRFLEIDVTPLAIGDSLHMKEIHLPEGVEIPGDLDYTVITVVGVKQEEPEVVEEEEEGVEETEEADDETAES